MGAPSFARTLREGWDPQKLKSPAAMRGFLTTIPASACYFYRKKLRSTKEKTNRLPVRRFTVSFILMGMVLVCSASAMPRPDVHPATACSHEFLKETATVGKFVFKAYSNTQTSADCLLVLRHNRVIYRQAHEYGGRYILGQHPNHGDDWNVPPIKNGTDITGNGHPDMIVSYYTGGAHCCLSTDVFELEPTFKLLATLNAKDSWPAYFADLHHNHHYFWIARDWTFAYWPSSFAGSPSAPIA